MSSHIDKQILRLFMFIHKVCLPVVRKFFEKFILSKQEYDNKFDKFLEHHKHDLYHMFCEVRCCECNTKTHKNECGQIFREHFVLMYDIGRPNHSHIKKKKDTDIALQNCICGIKVKLTCSKKKLDLSTLIAILRLFQTHLNNNHTMWLKMVSKQRNTLCHLSDFNQLTESDVNTMWGYLEMAVIGLATDIPVEDYEDDIKTQIEFLKEIDYSQDKVQPIIDEMKRGVRTIETLQNQQNEWIKDEFNNLQITREDDKKELIGHLSQSKDEIMSHQDRKTKAQEAKLDSVLEQLGKLFHKTKDQQYHVEYSFDSSFPLRADTQCKGAELESVEFETGPESQRDVAGHNDVCIYWKMKPRCCSKEEMDDIKASMRKAAHSLDCWFPYKITHIFDGSIVIGTIISGDVLESKHKFEESIRKFLDVFSSVFGLHRQVTIDVEIVISKSPSAAISNYCCYETYKATTRDKEVLATPHMLDKVVQASLDIDYKAHQIYAIKRTDQVGTYFYKVQIKKRCRIDRFRRDDYRLDIEYAIYIGCTPEVKIWIHIFRDHLMGSLLDDDDDDDDGDDDIFDNDKTLTYKLKYCSCIDAKEDAIIIIPFSGSEDDKLLLNKLDDINIKTSHIFILRFGDTQISNDLQQFRRFDVSISKSYADELTREIRILFQTCFIQVEIMCPTFKPIEQSMDIRQRPSYDEIQQIFIGCTPGIKSRMTRLAVHFHDNYYCVNGPSIFINVPPGSSTPKTELTIIIPITGSKDDQYLLQRIDEKALKSSNVFILVFQNAKIPKHLQQFRSFRVSENDTNLDEFKNWINKCFRICFIIVEITISTNIPIGFPMGFRQMRSRDGKHQIVIGCTPMIESMITRLAIALKDCGETPSYRTNVASGSPTTDREVSIVIPITGSEDDKYLLQRLDDAVLKSSNVIILAFQNTEIPKHLEQFKCFEVSKNDTNFDEIKDWIMQCFRVCFIKVVKTFPSDKLIGHSTDYRLCDKKHTIFIGCTPGIASRLTRLSRDLHDNYYIESPTLFINEASSSQGEFSIILPITGSEEDNYLLQRLDDNILKSSNVFILAFNNSTIPKHLQQFSSFIVSENDRNLHEVNDWIMQCLTEKQLMTTQESKSTKDTRSMLQEVLLDDIKDLEDERVKEEIQTHEIFRRKLTSTLDFHRPFQTSLTQPPSDKQTKFDDRWHSTHHQYVKEVKKEKHKTHKSNDDLTEKLIVNEDEGYHLELLFDP